MGICYKITREKVIVAMKTNLQTLYCNKFLLTNLFKISHAKERERERDEWIKTDDIQSFLVTCFVSLLLFI